MRYIESYKKFRLNESTGWDKSVEIEGKKYEVNWGMPKLELAEIFQTLQHHKSSLPKEWSESFGVIFNSERPDEFTHQTDPHPDFLEKPLESSMKGKVGTNPEIKYSCYELLQLESIGGKKDKDLEPYHNFIKTIGKAFWAGKKVQINESDLKVLAKNKEREGGDGDSGFSKILKDKTFIEKKKIYYETYCITDKNPDGIIPVDQIGKAGWIPKLNGGLLANMKEPKDPDQKKLWNELKDKKDSANIIWNTIIEYKTYFGGTFDYTTESIKKGSKIPLPAAVKMGNGLYLTGGNRRMTYFCYNNVLPTIWIW